MRYPAIVNRLVLPDSRFDVAEFGELVGDPSRVAMLLSLMDGQARPASELARLAGIERQTASFHLQRLVAGRLLRVDATGRHRYYRLAGDEVADALEAVSLLGAPRRPRRHPLAHARLCYRHLAGRLGVACLDALERAGFLCVREGAFALTADGVAWFESTGRTNVRWPAGKPCLDWTERRNHLGGELGALLAEHLLGLAWIARAGRAVSVTDPGQRGLAELGVPCSEL